MSLFLLIGKFPDDHPVRDVPPQTRRLQHVRLVDAGQLVAAFPRELEPQSSDALHLVLDAVERTEHSPRTQTVTAVQLREAAAAVEQARDNVVQAELEAGEGVTLLYSCAGRACGHAAQWANRVFRQRLLYGRQDLQQYLEDFQALVQEITRLEPNVDSEIILNLKERLDMSYEQCAGMPGDQAQLKEAGFRQPARSRLVPGATYYGFLAS